MKSGKNDPKRKYLVDFLRDPKLKKFALRVLQAEAEHDKKIDKLEESGVEAESLRLDLLDLVLDALRVPKDNSVGLVEKYGQEAYERPDLVCRDLFYERWSKCEKTEAAIENFLDWVIHEIEAPARN